jgi:hypothetical protein
MEQESKLLDIYKKSPFSNIGNKVSAIQNSKVPNELKISNFNTKSILEIQKDFEQIVVKPYGTVLSELSKVGNIKINPTTSVLRLFNQLNDVVSPVLISYDTNLLNVTSIYSNIKQPNSSDLLKYRILPSIEQPSKTSILNETTPEIKSVTISNNLIYSDTAQTNEFKTQNILNLNSTFDDIVEFKTTSLLNQKVPFETITDLPYSNVLEMNSKFDDLVIKDISSILKVYVASKVPETIPGVANFFADIYNTGFTLNAQQGQSLFNQGAIPEYREAKINPDKSIIDIVQMTETPEKNIVNINLIPVTPEKVGLNVIPSPDGPDKKVVDVNLMPDTPEKPIATLRDMIDVTKEGRDPIPMGPTPEKPIETLSEVDYIPNIDAEGFTANAEPLQTQFTYLRLPTIGEIPATPDKRSQATKPTAVNFIPNEKATGFTLNNGRLITEYNLKETPDLYAFTWNMPPGYPGVLNQYAVYFSKYPPLTNVTYKTIIDWAYNQTIRVPEARKLYSQGFHTPKVPINEFQLIVPPYQYANDRLPTWANTYVSTLEDVGSTLVSGFLSQKTFELITSIAGIDVSVYQTSDIKRNSSGDIIPSSNTISALKQSPLALHALAGEIYWEHNKLGTVVRNVREGVINTVSDLVGTTLANIFIPTLESAIGNATSNLINTTLNATVLDSDKVLILYHIMMGTKYTKSKAFFDRLTKTYSSKYGQIGDNALNLYNDQTSYQKYLHGDSVDAFGYAIPYVPTEITDVFLGNEVKGRIQSDDSISELKSTLSRVLNGYSQTMKIPIGNYEPGLINKYLKKDESKTFGTIIDPEKYYSVDMEVGRNIYEYDGPSLNNSIFTNYPTAEDIIKHPSLKVKTDLNALGTNAISDYTKVLSDDLYLAYKNTTVDRNKNEGSYYIQMTNILNGKKKLLDDKGFPSIATQFSDAKNRLNMIKMPKSDIESLGTEVYTDNDLIDFYFEDISSLSKTNESIVIPFRAILTTISDGTNATWGAQDYMGRADKFWIYQGFERHVAIAFDVAINSKDEFISSWNKINYLYGMCFPVEYPAQIALKAPIVALTVGNLFNRTHVILNSINLSFDGATIWELEQNYQLPTYIKIQTDFTVLFQDIPLADKHHFAQNQDWILPRIYDYNETNTQNSSDSNILTRDSSGNINIMKTTEFRTQLQNLGLINPFGV